MSEFLRENLRGPLMVGDREKRERTSKNEKEESESARKTEQ